MKVFIFENFTVNIIKVLLQISSQIIHASFRSARLKALTIPCSTFRRSELELKYHFHNSVRKQKVFKQSNDSQAQSFRLLWS